MKIKSPDEIIKGLRKRFQYKEENVYYLGRLFVAVSVIRWIFTNSSSNDEILSYLSQVERHMNEEIELYWSGNTIKVSKSKKGKS